MRSRDALFALFILLAGCEDDDVDGEYGRDTCTGGTNMERPRLVGGVELDPAGAFVRITWDPGTGRGANLPPSYFMAVAVETGAESALSHDGTEITVRLNGTPGSGSTTPFTLAFPDRARSIGCTHPGMNDTYLLDVTLIVDGAGQATATFAERTRLGDV